MRLLTLMEYCLLIFFMGIYLSATGFNASDFGLYIGLVLIYTLVHIFSKRFLQKRGKENHKIGLFRSVLAITGSVFASVLAIVLIVTVLTPN
ncbi:hypothetical protein [Bacillus pumilus]|uniref:hypothetical protein n=1 Tax=Bacillus pumilus TaxID=1408 RepID=UPI000717A29A|nr:hypothetical protein [Bacillus pumilus]KRU16884.1 hypothetical protein AS142_06265 [Bacillus pumilus]